jgi:hypothetical protein
MKNPLNNRANTNNANSAITMCANAFECNEYVAMLNTKNPKEAMKYVLNITATMWNFNEFNLICFIIMSLKG